MLAINHEYDLPFGHGRSYATSGPLSYIVGGWSVSGVWIIYSGQWFAASLATPVSNTQSTGAAVLTSTTERPNWVSNPNILPSGVSQNIYHWFNTGAFANPAPFTFGNSGLGIILGPGYFNLDAGIHREFAIKEFMKLQFRWEMFNSLNHPNFNNPNSTLGSSAFGTISSTLPARSQQAALMLVF
jgi:hypothetical protein